MPNRPISWRRESTLGIPQSFRVVIGGIKKARAVSIVPPMPRFISNRVDPCIADKTQVVLPITPCNNSASVVHSVGNVRKKLVPREER